MLVYENGIPVQLFKDNETFGPLFTFNDPLKDSLGPASIDIPNPVLELV